MRIISKFKDYYDIGLAYGVDPKLVYVRATHTIDLDINSEKNKKIFTDRNATFQMYGKKPFRYPIDGCYILFCGELYLAFKVNNVWVYNAEDFSKAIEATQNKEVIEYYNENRRFYQTRGRSYKEYYEAVFSRLEEINRLNKNYFNELHRKYNSPIITIHTVSGIVSSRSTNVYVKKDTKLKDFRFASAVDPYTAWQKLSMFYGNIIGIQENQIITIADEDRIAMHGFNEKSFRNPNKLKDL